MSRGTSLRGLSTLDQRVLNVYNEFMKLTVGWIYYAQNNSRAGDLPPGRGV